MDTTTLCLFTRTLPAGAVDSGPRAVAIITCQQTEKEGLRETRSRARETHTQADTHARPPFHALTSNVL